MCVIWARVARKTGQLQIFRLVITVMHSCVGPFLRAFVCEHVLCVLVCEFDLTSCPSVPRFNTKYFGADLGFFVQGVNDVLRRLRPGQILLGNPGWGPQADSSRWVKS